MLTKRVMEKEKPMVIWGSGNQRRNYVHAAHDCARVMLQLVENGYHERPINLGREETVFQSATSSCVWPRSRGVELELLCGRFQARGPVYQECGQQPAARGAGRWLPVARGLARGAQAEWWAWYQQTFSNSTNPQ